MMPASPWRLGATGPTPECPERGRTKLSVTLNPYSHPWPSAEDKTRTGAASVMESVNLADSGRTGGPQTRLQASRSD